MASTIRTAASLMALAALGACTTAAGPDRSIVDACIRQAGMSGQYKVEYALVSNTQSYQVVPGQGSTVVQAAAANACIAQASGQTTAAGPVPGAVYYTPSQKKTAALSGGTGYHGSVLTGGKTSGAVAAAPAPVKAAKGKNLGGLPLPMQYPLLPGDPALWNTLTKAQQERALLFLSDGSTIAASLRTD